MAWNVICNQWMQFILSHDDSTQPDEPIPKHDLAACLIDPMTLQTSAEFLKSGQRAIEAEHQFKLSRVLTNATFVPQRNVGLTLGVRLFSAVTGLLPC